MCFQTDLSSISVTKGNSTLWFLDTCIHANLPCSLFMEFEILMHWQCSTVHLDIQWNPCKHHQEQIFCLLVLFGVFFLISCLSCFKVLSRLSYSHGPFCTSSFVQACFIVIIMNIVLLYQHCIVLHCNGHFNVLLSDVSPPCQRLFYLHDEYSSTNSR